jgi:hypothetical protein
MATAYSTLLGLALPVQGELSGTWGDMVDNGITRYVDIAVAGTVTLTNDGAVTLSLTNGDSSATNIVSSLTGAGTVSAQFAIIKVTGTLTTAKVLTPPSSSRTYVVVNAATGSTVTVKAATQPGVSIAVGETAFVYFNGTDYVKVAGTVNTGVTSFTAGTTGFTPSTATTGAVTLAGTLATTNGGTGLTSFTSGGVVYASSTSALTTGSALTFDGSLFSVLGSGSLEVARFGTSTNSTPSVGIYSNGSIRLKLRGSSAEAAILSQGAIDLLFGVNDTEGMRLTSTGLGIGTSSPTNAKLSVTSSTPTSSAPFTGTQIKLCGDGLNNSNYSGIAYRTSSSTDNYGWSAGAIRTTDVDVGGFAFNFHSGTAAGVEKMRLDTAGNLGLGVTPSAWGSTYKALEGSFGQSWFYSNTATITGLVSNTFNNGTNWIYKTANASSRYELADNHKWFIAPAGTLGNAISFTQAMTLDASGNLALGTTTVANANSDVLTVGKNSASYDVAVAIRQFANGTAANLQLIAANDAGAAYNSITSTTSGGTQHWRLGGVAGFTGGLAIATSGTEKSRFSAAGGFSVGTTADPGAGGIYATGNITAYYSDKRLKTVSGKIENALDKVAQLSGVYYTNNSVAKSFGYDSDEVQVGVLAQDVEAVLPQIVKAAPFDLDQDGNSKSGENYKTVQYERLVPLLIEAINELRAEVKALKGV